MVDPALWTVKSDSCAAKASTVDNKVSGQNKVRPETNQMACRHAYWDTLTHQPTLFETDLHIDSIKTTTFLVLYLLNPAILALH